MLIFIFYFLFFTFIYLFYFNRNDALLLLVWNIDGGEEHVISRDQ